jgi:hypothetical protein
MANIKLFIDFWNFQISWNDHIKPAEGSEDTFVKIGWRNLPHVLIGELPSVLGPSTEMVYKGTQVYASVNPKQGSADEKLKGFLHSVLGQMTGYKVHVRDRRFKRDTCPKCSKSIDRMVEKGVDTSIVTDLFSGAINDAYDVAVLVSNDSDFVPAIQTIQERLNKQIIHIGFRHGGDHVRTAAWSHIILDGAVADKVRE